MFIRKAVRFLQKFYCFKVIWKCKLSLSTYETCCFLTVGGDSHLVTWITNRKKQIGDYIFDK